MSLRTPVKLQRLRAALYHKAKHEPNSRFSALDDKGWRADMLAPAYTRNRQHEGAPGVDGQTLADREAYGGERWGRTSSWSSGPSAPLPRPSDE